MGTFFHSLILKHVYKKEFLNNHITKYNQTYHFLGYWKYVFYEKDSSLQMEHLDDLQFFSLSKVARATDNFCISNKIGEGGFGPVYKVIW